MLFWVKQEFVERDEIWAPLKTPAWEAVTARAEAKGAFHLPELTGRTIPVVMRITLLIKTIQPDQSNPK